MARPVDGPFFGVEKLRTVLRLLRVFTPVGNSRCWKGRDMSCPYFSTQQTCKSAARCARLPSRRPTGVLLF